MRSNRRPRPPQIRYCSTPDGIDLPYAISGQGPTLIKVANWLNHLEHDWASPMWGPLFQTLSRDSSLLRYDSRGVGLANWEVGDIGFEDFVTDLETFIEANNQAKFALLGISQGAAIAIDYAARNPDRVTHLILWGGFARGRPYAWKRRQPSGKQGICNLDAAGLGQGNVTLP